MKFLFYLLLFSFALNAQEKINIAGYVREAVTGEALIGANVLLYQDSSTAGEMLRGAASNKFGYYSIPNVKPDNYFFIVSSVGYKTVKKNYNLSDSTLGVTIIFFLEKTAVTIDEVVVQDQKHLTFSPTASTIDLDPELIQKLPSLGGETDVFRALQLLPGITSASEISTGIYVRGGSPDQNLILIDGVTVYNPSHLGGFASTFNSDLLSSIKLIKGGFPAEYGGRLSSVLDLTMREGTKEDFKGDVKLNNISSRITMEGPLSDKSTYILSGRIMYLDRIMNLIPRLDYIPRYNFFDLNGKVNYHISDMNRIFFSGFYSKDRIKQPPSNEDIDFELSWENATFNLTWTNIATNKIYTNTSLLYTSYNSTTLIKGKVPSNESYDFYTSSQIHDFALKRDMQIFLSEDHIIKTGAEVTMHIFSITTSDLYIKELEYKPIIGSELISPEISLYGQDDWNISDKFKLNFGTRLYYLSKGKLLTIEPRVTASYFPFDRLVIRSAFGIANQPVHLLYRSDIFLPTDVWYPSTDRIEPGRSIQGSFGFEATSLDKTFLFTFDAYYKDLKNLYEYKQATNFSFFADFEDQLTPGRGEAYGFEFFLNKRIGNFMGWIGYTLSWTKRYFSDLNRGVFYYPRYDRRHDISIVITQELTNNFNIGLTWTYGTGQAISLPVSQYFYPNFSGPGNSEEILYIENSSRDAFRLPAFHKLDVSCNYNIIMGGNELEFSLNLYNAYNRYNVFSKYIGFKEAPDGEKYPVLRQFTLFPILPSLGVRFKL